MTLPPPPEAVTATMPALVADRYVIEGLLGRGGSAAVYAAQDRRLGRRVALKVLHPHLDGDPELAAAFQAEARAVARLNHRHIVTVHDVGVRESPDDGWPSSWIVLELVDGVTLAAVLEAGREPLPPADTCALLAQVLDALAHAHDAGIVHRDVSPANIMLTRDGTAKVMDFGIAAAVDPARRGGAGVPGGVGRVRGTAHYIAPEQAAGCDVDARADVYATGCVLFALLTGRPPFRDGTAAQVAGRHVHVPAPRLSAVRPGLPAELDAVLARALAKDPSARFPDARAMLAAVTAAARRLGAPGSLQALVAEMTVAPAVGARDAETTVLRRVEGGTSVLPTVARPPSVATPVPAVEPGATGRSLPRAGPKPVVPVHPPPPAESTVSPWGWVVVVLAVLAVVGAVVAWFAAAPAGSGAAAAPSPSSAAPSASTPDTVAEVTVPDVAGRTVEEATALLAGSGLRVLGSTERSHEVVAAGLVVASDPPRGASVPPDTAVTLAVSTGPAPIDVPVLEGLSLARAREVLARAGLELGELLREDSNQPADAVLGSDPPAGTPVQRGTVVALVLASGSQSVPDVRGVPLDRARTLLEGAGFVAVLPDGADPAAPVMAVQPRPGTVLRLGSEVTLVPTPEPTRSPTPDPARSSSGWSSPPPTPDPDPTSSP
ncbi:MAG: protein kinase domain-containing protein [Actinomycetes bacterium]